MKSENGKKTVFLTSSPDGSYQVDGEWVTGPFTERNGFLQRFKEACPDCPQVLLITATPDDKEKTRKCWVILPVFLPPAKYRFKVSGCWRELRQIRFPRGWQIVTW